MGRQKEHRKYGDVRLLPESLTELLQQQAKSLEIRLKNTTTFDDGSEIINIQLEYKRDNTTVNLVDGVYEYKNKKYRINKKLKLKLEGVWVDAIEYECLYPNPDGRFWVRTEVEFFKKFKIN